MSASAAEDTPELEALFDSIVASQVGGDPQTAEAANDAPSGDAATAAEMPAMTGDVFTDVGHLTRQLHDTLRELGHDRTLADAADSIPDARQRLSYVAELTEKAAQRVLGATERAQPLQDRIDEHAAALDVRWEAVFNGQSGPDDLKQLALDTRAFLADSRANAAATRAELLEIVMAQDFQDLTGQVMKRMTELTAELEKKLLSILLEHAPVAREVDAQVLLGPAYSESMKGEVLANQAEVDALLESLGF